MNDEMFALAAGLQFAYWLWNATMQPAMTRFSDKIGEALGEIGAERLKRWFGVTPPTDAHGKVDESDGTQQQIIAAARSKIESDAEWDSDKFMNTTKRVLVQLLRDPTQYSMGNLQVFWQEYGEAGIEFNLLVAQYTLVGNVQASVADRLVMEAIRNRKLPELIAAMRQARP